MATREELAELCLVTRTAAGYRKSYEAKGALGKIWDKGATNTDYHRWKILENLNRRHKAAIKSAADGESVVAVPGQIEVDVNLGGVKTKLTNSEFLTARQAKFREQYSNLEAAGDTPTAAVAMIIAPDNTAAIQISGAAWEILSNTAIAWTSHAGSNAKITVENTSGNKTIVPKAVGADVLNKKPARMISEAKYQEILDDAAMKGSGGSGKVYEIPGEQLTSGLDYIGKTKQPIPKRMQGHKNKTNTGEKPQPKILAKDLTDNEMAGIEAILIEERGLDNLTNIISGLNPIKKKNIPKFDAGQKVIDKYKE